jgi:hypothetical protein
MPDERSTARPTTNGRGDLIELRRANWLLASRAAQQLGDHWDWADTEFEFLCECGRCGCSMTLELPLVSYVIAASRRRLVVAHGHQSPLDTVEDHGGSYLVISSGGFSGESLPGKGEALAG